MANLIGTAGEHFVAGELGRRGFLVTLTRGNAPGVDVLAYHPVTQKTLALQVKTANSAKQAAGKWIMNVKDANEAAVRSQAVVFVRLGEPPAAPEYSIAPSQMVARILAADHAAWEAAPGAQGQPHSLTNPMRTFKDPAGEWRDRWDIIMRLAGLLAEAESQDDPGPA